jgi:aspartyl protease family protein
LSSKNPNDPYQYSSFRPGYHAKRNAKFSSVPGLKWLLVTLALAVFVIGYDRLRSSGPEPMPVQPYVEQAPQPEEQAQPPRSQAPATVEQAPNYAASVPAPVAAAEPAQEPEEPKEAPPEEVETVINYEMEKSPTGFVGTGQINGKDVSLLADTGARHVVVPEAIARELGLKKGEPIQFATGGGNIVHYSTMIDKLTLGRLDLKQVFAVINPAMQTKVILLGMDVMGLLNMKVEGNKLLLQYKVAPSAQPAAPVDTVFKRSSKDCAGQGNKFDRRALDCLQNGVQ